MSSHTIYASWNSILPSDNQSTEETYESNTSDNEDGSALTTWLETKDEPHSIMNDQELLDFCKNDTVPDEEPVEETIPTPNILAFSEASVLLTDILSTLENDSNSSKEEILIFRNVLTRWRDQQKQV